MMSELLASLVREARILCLAGDERSQYAKGRMQDEWEKEREDHFMREKEKKEK